MKKVFILVAAVLLACQVQAQRSAFNFEGVQIDAGTSRSFNVKIPSSGADSTYMPVTVIHGRENGPVLGLTAGIHGYEYPPIIALQKLPDSIDASALKGTVILVHIANVPAFLGRNVYINPVDGKNLNRSFPGRQNGTLTERMAYLLGEKLLAKIDYYIDVHAGDANEDLQDYAGYTRQGPETEMSAQMARAMGFDWIMVSAGTKNSGKPSLYSTQESVNRGVPTLAIECGRLGGVGQEEPEKINRGIMNVMRLLKMVPGTAIHYRHAIEISSRQSLNSASTGIFYSHCKSGQIIKKGMSLGYITDFFGKVVEEIKAPIDGMIVYMVATPPVSKGELLFNIAALPVKF